MATVSVKRSILSGFLSDFHMALKNKRKKERKQKCKIFNWLIKQKQTSTNFHWLGERGYRQHHLSADRSGKRPAFCFDVI